MLTFLRLTSVTGAVSTGKPRWRLAPTVLWVLSTDFAVTAAFACPFWTLRIVLGVAALGLLYLAANCAFHPQETPTLGEL